MHTSQNALPFYTYPATSIINTNTNTNTNTTTEAYLYQPNHSSNSNAPINALGAYVFHIVLSLSSLFS